MTFDDRMAVRDFYATRSDDEWERLTRDIAGRVAFEVHRRMLERFVTPGMQVLEIGAGPGRFTAELARLGATVTVTDLTPEQLASNRARFTGTAVAEQIADWQVLDVCDTSVYADGAFDAVVAYGGPLSYAFEGAPGALAGLLRVTQDGGPVLASVMSMLGSWRHFIGVVLSDVEAAGNDAYRHLMATGDLRSLGAPHICQLYRSDDITALVEGAGAEVIAMSASNWASLGDPEALAEFEADPMMWAQFLDDEVAACAAPGALDGGTHIVFAARA